MKWKVRRFLCMHLGTTQTAGNRSIDVYTDPKKDPRSKYCFIFENELEIVGEVAKKKSCHKGEWRNYDQTRLVRISSFPLMTRKFLATSPTISSSFSKMKQYFDLGSFLGYVYTSILRFPAVCAVPRCIHKKQRTKNLHRLPPQAVSQTTILKLLNILFFVLY